MLEFMNYCMVYARVYVYYTIMIGLTQCRELEVLYVLMRLWRWEAADCVNRSCGITKSSTFIKHCGFVRVLQLAAVDLLASHVVVVCKCIFLHTAAKSSGLVRRPCDKEASIGGLFSDFMQCYWQFFSRVITCIIVWHWPLPHVTLGIRLTYNDQLFSALELGQLINRKVAVSLINFNFLHV